MSDILFCFTRWHSESKFWKSDICFWASFPNTPHISRNTTFLVEAASCWCFSAAGPGGLVRVELGVKLMQQNPEESWRKVCCSSNFGQQFWTWTHSYTGRTEIQQCLCPGVAVVRDCGGTCYLLTPGPCACKFTELGQSYKEEWGEIAVCPHEKTTKCQKELERYDYLWNHLFVLKPICSFHFDTIYCFFFFLLSVSKIPVTPTESKIYCCKAAQETSAGWAALYQLWELILNSSWVQHDLFYL